MLSKAEVVATRKAIEMGYTDTCAVIEHKKVTRANKSTGFEEVTVLEGERCKLSFSSAVSAGGGENATSLAQSAKLFISPDVTIKAGSKVIITRNNEVYKYCNSGVQLLFATHQEIGLELFRGWA